MRHRLTLGSLTDRHRSLPAVLESDMDRQAQWKGWWMTLTRRGTHVKRLWMQMLWSLSWQYINKTSAAGFQPETFNTPKFSSATPERNERLISTSSCGSTQITSGTRYFFPDFVCRRRSYLLSVGGILQCDTEIRYVSMWLHDTAGRQTLFRKKAEGSDTKVAGNPGKCWKSPVSNLPDPSPQGRAGVREVSLHRLSFCFLGKCSDLWSMVSFALRTHGDKHTISHTNNWNPTARNTLLSISTCGWNWLLPILVRNYDNMFTMDLICTVHYKLR